MLNCDILSCMKLLREQVAIAKYIVVKQLYLMLNITTLYLDTHMVHSKKTVTINAKLMSVYRLFYCWII